jgi:aspartyl/glutamyl-tRNA(Asn/Gln) amidotransferase C subunit
MQKPQIDVQVLAQLARIEISDAEVKKLEQELPSILDFVATIQALDVSTAHSTPALRNVMRDDENPHETGTYTEALLAQAPARQGDRFAVKQVISRKKQ